MSAAIGYPRQFVVADAELTSWTAIEPYYQRLAERELPDQAAFQAWLHDFSELESVIAEVGTLRYTDMTRATADETRKSAYLDYVQKIEPQCAPWRDRLRGKLVEAADALGVADSRYDVLLRSNRAQRELYREANIPLLTEDAQFAQQYQEISGAMTIMHDEQELTLQQAERYLEEPDRNLREEVWRRVADRRLQDAGRLDALYDEMVQLRHRIAQQADCADYREYAWREKERFDYSVEDCLEFHETIARVCVPAAAQFAAERRRKLGIERLRPWDLHADPEGRPPLRPFETADELADRAARVFHQVDPELGAQFDRLRREGLLDLDSRKGKAPGGYQAVFEERRLPFIFMNAAGTERDVQTLLHEGGHAFHTFATRDEPLLPYRHAPMEFAEVASMAMECLAARYTETFYGGSAPRARKRFFTEIVEFFPRMARIDAFQHYVYTHLDADPEARKDQWLAIDRRFAPHVDYSDLESHQRHSWHRVLHLFEVPFYIVEYGIAQLGALQVWLNANRDFEEAVRFYRQALALGGARPLPELFEAANLKFDFSEATMAPLIAAAVEAVEREPA